MIYFLWCKDIFTMKSMTVYGLQNGLIFLYDDEILEKLELEER